MFIFRWNWYILSVYLSIRLSHHVWWRFGATVAPVSFARTYLFAHDDIRVMFVRSALMNVIRCREILWQVSSYALLFVFFYLSQSLFAFNSLCDGTIESELICRRRSDTFLQCPARYFLYRNPFDAGVLCDTCNRIETKEIEKCGDAFFYSHAHKQIDGSSLMACAILTVMLATARTS